MKKFHSILVLLLLLATTAYAQTINLACIKPAETFYSAGNDLYVVMDEVNGDYQFVFDIICAQGDTDIVDGQTYTLTDMLTDYCFGIDRGGQQYISFSSVSFVRNAGAYTVNVTDTSGVNYLVTYTPPTPTSQYVDSVSITMDNGRKNDINDFTSSEGNFQLIGYDMTMTYIMYLCVNSNQIAGTYTIDDINSEYTSLYVNQNMIRVNAIRGSFTVTGDANACSTYVELIGEDSILYKITYTYPGIAVPITPIDTVDVFLNNCESNGVSDNSNIGSFILEGYDINRYYGLLLYVFSNHFAGTYTKDDVDLDFSSIIINGNDIEIFEINDFTVVGNADTCSTYLEIIGEDSVFYRVTFVYPCIIPPIIPVDTVDIVLDDPTKNSLDKLSDRFLIFGYNDSYEFTTIFLSDTIAGIYTYQDLDSSRTELYAYSATDTTQIYPLEFRSIVVTGDTTFLNAHIEMISEDSVLYRISFIYPGVVEPTDTVVITLDNSEENAVYDETATNGSFTLIGADQNGEYGLVMIVNSNHFAGAHTQASVAVLELVHATATDTADILYSEIRDFTVTGDANNCSTYIEMASSDGIFYKMTFTYTGYTPPTEVENTEIMFVAYSEENTIVINGAEGERMAVYDMTGKMIANTKATSSVERINVGVAGIYVVRIGKQALKVVVK